MTGDGSIPSIRPDEGPPPKRGASDGKLSLPSGKIR